MDAKWVKAPTLAALQVAKYMRTVCEVMGMSLNRTYIGKENVA